MAHKSVSRRLLAKTKSVSDNTVTYLSKIRNEIKRNTISRLINKEEDEDNDQTFWPFTSTGRLSFSRLS
jgi:hypothetical protein